MPKSSQTAFQQFPKYREIPLRRAACRYCGVKTFTKEKKSFCCNCGKAVLPLRYIPRVPRELKRLYKHKNFSKESRKLNNMFSFASIGTHPTRSNDGRGFLHFQGSTPSFVALQGRVTHRIIPADIPTSPLMYYFYDSSPCINQRRIELPRTMLESFAVYMKRKNVYGRQMMCMGEILKGTTHEQVQQFELQYDTNVSDFNCVYRSENGVPPASNGVIFPLQSREGEAFMIDNRNPMYDGLSYPVLNPMGILGNDYEQKPLSVNGDHQELSRLYFARQIVLRSETHQLAGRLFNEWLCDMQCTTERERLLCIANDPNTQRATRGYRQSSTYSASDTILPASYKGSKRANVQLVEDALTVCGKFGRPDFFITMTTNPNWPEIKKLLKPHQSAFDRPDLTARVFRMKLQSFMDDLDVGSILVHKRADIEYRFVVTEYQQRGLPHAHIVIKYKDLNLQLSDIDNIVKAELPHERMYNEEYKARVQKWMIHKHTHESACMQDGKCSKRFPKSVNDKTNIDGRGYVQYKRSTERDVYVVPHSPNLLMRYSSLNTLCCIKIGNYFMA